MIRPAVPEDAEGLARIARAAYRSYEADIGSVPPPALQDFPADIAASRVWVTGDPVAGYAVAYAKPDRWFLENIAIAPEAQGQGLGRA